MLYDSRRWDKGLKVDETSRLLNQAADVIEHFGHCKGALERGEAHCLIGAVTVVDGKGELFGNDRGRFGYDALERLRKYIYLVHYGDIAEWNNRPERIAEEVVAALRGAAE